MDELELTDLGDAKEETKQCIPYGVFVDSYFGWGPYEQWPGGGPCGG